MSAPNRNIFVQSFKVPFEYPVVFTRGVFHEENSVLSATLNRLGEKRRHRVFVFIDSSVEKHHRNLSSQIQRYFQKHANVELVSTPQIVTGGESIKNNLPSVGEIINTLIQHNLCRHSFVVVVGGGAVLDTVGFAASLVHRGLRLVRIPTTVLAQNDSGVGVKNAINFGDAKNMLGTFAPPFAVINDFEFISTLPDQAWTDGIAEAFKVSIIKDKAFFDYLCAQADSLKKRNQEAMEYLIMRCAELHLEHICSSGDPFEFGQARPLDFGHWAAHKLEIMSHYRISHGSAVAIGIVLDSLYARHQGWLTRDEFEAIYKGLSDSGFKLWDDLLARQGKDGLLEIINGLRDFQEHLGGELCITMPQGLGAKNEINEMDHGLLEVVIGELCERARLCTSPTA